LQGGRVGCLVKMPIKNKKNRRIVKSRKQENKQNKIMLIVAIVLVGLVVSLYAIKLAMTANAIKIQEEQVKYYDWLVDNCKCLSHERIFCREGFELSEHKEFCRADGKITNVLKGCSEYDCSGEIVSWDEETKLWSPVLNFEE